MNECSHKQKNHNQTRANNPTIWWLYIIETAKGQYYTGISTDPIRRFEEHLQKFLYKKGRGAKYFLGHKPEKIVYQKKCKNRPDASKQENNIKKLSAKNKKALFIQT